MKKPVPKRQSVEILDYHEAARWVGEKLGYSIRDTLGKFANKEVTKYDFRDWWYFLSDQANISNGGVVAISSNLLEAGNDWQNVITQKFIDEFGDGSRYRVEW